MLDCMGTHNADADLGGLPYLSTSDLRRRYGIAEPTPPLGRPRECLLWAGFTIVAAIATAGITRSEVAGVGVFFALALAGWLVAEHLHSRVCRAQSDALRRRAGDELLHRFNAAQSQNDRAAVRVLREWRTRHGFTWVAMGDDPVTVPPSPPCGERIPAAPAHP